MKAPIDEFPMNFASKYLLPYCYQALNVRVEDSVNFQGFAGEKESRRADLRTAHLLQLRVSQSALQGFAQVCKLRISKPVPLLCRALRCTVLRSRWCQHQCQIGQALPNAIDWYPPPTALFAHLIRGLLLMDIEVGYPPREHPIKQRC
jgi:hypothetical protein